MGRETSFEEEGGHRNLGGAPDPHHRAWVRPPMGNDSRHSPAGTVAELRRALDEQSGELSSLFHTLDDAVLARRPPSGKWSPVEHVDHLIKVNQGYLRALDQALGRGRAAGKTGTGPFKGSVVGRFFARSMEPPVKRRMKTMKAMLPDHDLAVEPTLAVFLDHQASLREILATAEGLDLDAIRMSSPFVKVVRAPVFNWFSVVLAHNRRHIWLIREALEG